MNGMNSSYNNSMNNPNTAISYLNSSIPGQMNIGGNSMNSLSNMNSMNIMNNGLNNGQNNSNIGYMF